MPSRFGYGTIGSGQYAPRSRVAASYDQYDNGYDTSSGTSGPLRQLVRQHNINTAWSNMNQSDRNQLAPRPEGTLYNTRGDGSFVPSGVGPSPLMNDAGQSYVENNRGGRPRFTSGTKRMNEAGGVTDVGVTPSGGLSFNGNPSEQEQQRQAQMAQHTTMLRQAYDQRNRDIRAQRFLARGGNPGTPAAHEMMQARAAQQFNVDAQNNQMLANQQFQNNQRTEAWNLALNGREPSPTGQPNVGGFSPNEARDFHNIINNSLNGRAPVAGQVPPIQPPRTWAQWAAGAPAHGQPQGLPPQGLPPQAQGEISLDSIGRGAEELTPTVVRGAGGLAGAWAGGKAFAIAGAPFAPYTYGIAPVVTGAIGSILGYHYGDKAAHALDQSTGLSQGINDTIPDAVSGALIPAAAVATAYGGYKYARKGKVPVPTPSPAAQPHPFTQMGNGHTGSPYSPAPAAQPHPFTQMGSGYAGGPYSPAPAPAPAPAAPIQMPVPHVPNVPTPVQVAPVPTPAVAPAPLPNTVAVGSPKTVKAKTRTKAEPATPVAQAVVAPRVESPASAMEAAASSAKTGGDMLNQIGGTKPPRAARAKKPGESTSENGSTVQEMNVEPPTFTTKPPRAAVTKKATVKKTTVAKPTETKTAPVSDDQIAEMYGFDPKTGKQIGSKPPVNVKKKEMTVSQPPAQIELPEFASLVKSLANASPEKHSFYDKAFIKPLWEASQSDNSFPRMTIDEFKSRLIDANRARIINLSRADLVK